jgi:phosphoenolpyruvate synthase/pyruvate phosphate dikinase
MVDSLIGVHTLDPELASVVGNKAANFGLLYEVSKTGKYKTPEAAFAIPFYWYDNHMQQSGAALLIRQLIDHPPADQDSLQLQLKAIQKLIKKSKVDPALLTRIDRRLRSSGYTTFRFRSSTNAEDAAGFSGAGLYDSKTVDLNDSTKTVEEALQKVWASLWSYEAYLERNYFGIADEDVAMGILVHRSFPNEAANGVAITKNIYRNSYTGFVINVQKGDVSVVTPPSGVVCDQLVLYPANELSGFQRTIEVITTSSLTDGELVMTKEELNRLQTELERIKRYYWQHAYKKKYSDSYEEFGLDLEFKLDEITRELYIKQVRVYNY